MDYSTELTSKINQTGKTKRYIQKELEISQWKLDGFSSGRLEAKKWEKIGLLAALDVMIDKLYKK